MSYVKIGNLEIGSNKRIMLTRVESSNNTSRRETRYAGYDGADFDDITIEPRMVTVKGILFGSSYSDIKALQKALSNACNPKKEVEVRYYNGDAEYYAKALPSLPVYAKVNNFTYQFIIYLEISKFYWLSAEEIVQGIYRKTDNVFGEELMFPRALTILEQGADIYNMGSVEVPVIIEIAASESFTDTITIKNVTYNKQIVIENYTVTEGEVITIDTDEQTVTSSIQGNIIAYLSENSELFNLPLGYTRIECEREGLTIVSKYRERFLEV